MKLIDADKVKKLIGTFCDWDCKNCKHDPLDCVHNIKRQIDAIPEAKCVRCGELEEKWTPDAIECLTKACARCELLEDENKRLNFEFEKMRLNYLAIKKQYTDVQKESE